MIKLLVKHLESIPEAFTASRFCRWYIPKWGNAEASKLAQDDSLASLFFF